jgi:2-dehydro-3-deoxygluconokinase
MKTSEQLWNLLKERRLVALLVPQSPEQCVRAWEALEIALRTDAAFDGMIALRRKYPKALFLAGTVLTRRHAEQAIEAGAAGVVSPDYFPAVLQSCVHHDVMCVPGGLSDAGKQLAHKAELYGCGIEELRRRYPYQWIYKCFPAMAGAPANIDAARAWKAVYEDLAVIYTGGVTAQNLREIVRRDPDAIICGSALTRNADDEGEMRREAERWLGALHPPRKPEADHETRGAVLKPEGRPPTVVTFGEIMLRLSPQPGLRLGQLTSMDATFGGAEANVAVALADWGAHARFVSAVPPNAIGDAAINVLRSRGVETAYIIRLGRRLGIYFLEHGVSQRPSRVIYDRAGSSITEITPEQIDWEAILHGADWFHVTGITPALGAPVAQAARDAIRAARQSGARISLDVNYRARLWAADQAHRTLAPMMEHVNLLICNEADAADVFGIGIGASDARSGQVDTDDYEDISRRLAGHFDLPMVAITLREADSASDNLWSACLLDDNTFYRSKRYPIHIVDRVGGGDAFAAGLIYALLSGQKARDALEFAVAASCLKQTVLGDFSMAGLSEVQSLAAGETSGRIKR